VGLRFQAEAIREYIARGKQIYRYVFFSRMKLIVFKYLLFKGELEHPFATHDNSRLIMSIMDEARKQLGAETY
jgi:hypothetical protein